MRASGQRIDSALPIRPAANRAGGRLHWRPLQQVARPCLLEVPYLVAKVSVAMVRRWAMLFAPLCVCICSWTTTPPARAADEESSQAVADEHRSFTALQAAVELNLDYSSDWLSGKDFKSLAATAGGIEILTKILAQLDESPAWQQQVKSLDDQLARLEQAAASKDESAAKEAIDALRTQNHKLKFQADGRRAENRRPAAGLRQLMNLLDGTYADAKAALAVGDFDDAKSTAIVLSELGGEVSNLRQGEDWQQWSRAMTQAATSAASSSSKDRKQLIAEFKQIYRQCENCHNRDR